MEYLVRLKELKSYSLTERRLRGDLILMHRMMTNDIIIRIDHSRLFTPKGISKTRGHSMKFNLKRRSNLDVCHHFFTNRVIIPWNNLPEYIVKSNNVDEFKENYDKWLGIVV